MSQNIFGFGKGTLWDDVAGGMRGWAKYSIGVILYVVVLLAMLIVIPVLVPMMVLDSVWTPIINRLQKWWIKLIYKKQEN